MELKIKKNISRNIFEKFYEKYTNLDNWWKKRSYKDKEELFKNFAIVEYKGEVVGWFSIKKFKNWFLIETLFSLKKWAWKKIIKTLQQKYNILYAFSKNDNFFDFEKLEETSESGAKLFVYKKFWIK